MASSEGKTVSVVIPVSDRPQELSRAIDSVLSQSYSLIEIIVVENNSRCVEDISAVVLAFDDERVKLFHLSCCDNASVARNFGADQSVGDYVAYLDSDDQWQVQHVENCLQILQSSGADFAYGPIIVDNGETQELRVTRSLEPKESAVNYLVGKNYGWAQTSTYFMTRQVVEKRRWDERLRRHQDLDFFCSVASGFRLVVNEHPDVLVYWEKGGKRNFDAASLFLFYDKWKAGMSLETRRFYCSRRVRDLYRNACYGSAARMSITLFLVVPRLFLFNVKNRIL